MSRILTNSEEDEEFIRSRNLNEADAAIIRSMRKRLEDEVVDRLRSAQPSKRSTPPADGTDSAGGER